MKSHILLHKLIFAELILAMAHGTFIFPHEPVYGWYLSVTAIGLNISWALHNVIAWMKNRPFLSRKVSIIYIVTVVLCWPYWGLEIYANFTYFNNINKIFLTTRPMEPLFRDPWWVFTTASLFWTIKREYNFGLWELVVVSPRFGIMLAAMCLSIIFMIVDTCSVLNAFPSILPTGVEPFWKLSFIFKCLCDTVILDDFKTALDHLRIHWMRKKNGELFVTPLTATPNSSPRAYRNRRDRDIEAGDDPSTPTKGSYGRAVHMDDV
ncbi:Pc12g10620 [Penicillium rubens Wisconsin 54-1255]|uniref:Pc12g10620 protein n=2 Tax=Penicillium chrysogenum species complex TaxID=254878 RepID=B6H0S0_PENRW|nr:Pc12g10620 [Penicillium rubens Wisconsin 54-1255]